jgi:hypothetical protein
VLYWGDTESDPQRLIETWLATNTYNADDRWYGRVRLATYRVAPAADEPVVETDDQFDECITLSGYALTEDRFAPGDIVPVTLFWETQASITERYKVTVQLIDQTGQLVTQRDMEPGAGLSPTDTWQPGQRVVDRYGLSLPVDLTPGRYTLLVALYHVSSGERLPLATGDDSMVLCEIGIGL